MTTFVVPFCLFLMVAASGLALKRLLSGPTVLDRVIGFDMIAICIVGMMVLLSVWWKTHLFIEIMLIFSLLGFAGTVAFVSYLHSNPSKLRLREKRKTDAGGGAP